MSDRESDSHPTAAVREAFEDLSGEMRTRLLNASLEVAHLPKEKVTRLLEFVARSGGRPRYGQSPEDAVKEIDFQARDGGAILSLVSAMVNALVVGRVSAEDFTADAGALGVIHSEARTTFEALSKEIATSRVEYLRLLRRRMLADSILPSLEGFAALIDIRPGFAAGKPRTFVPVAVAQLWTDTGDPPIRFQFTAEQAKKLIADLQELMNKFESAETVIRRFPAS